MPRRRRLSLSRDTLTELTVAEAVRVAGAVPAPSDGGGALDCHLPASLYLCLTIHAGCSHGCTG